MLAFLSSTVIFQAVFANAIVNYFEVKFTSMPLHDFLFLTAYLRPVCGQISFLLMVLSFSWRIKSIEKILIISELTSTQQLEIIGKIFGKCDKIIFSMNNLFAINFMTSLFDLLVMTLVTTFLAYDIIVHELTISDAILMLGGVSYINISGFICFTIIFILSGMDDKRKILMIKINNLKLNQKKKVDKFFFLSINQLDFTQIKLSCGLFYFKKSQIFVMISSFFSYLVVMIQFDFVLAKELKSIAGNN